MLKRAIINSAVPSSSSTKAVQLADRDDYGDEEDLKLEISSRAAAAATATVEPTDCDMDALKKVQQSEKTHLLDLNYESTR